MRTRQGKSAVLNTGLNDFSRKYLIKGNDPPYHEAIKCPDVYRNSLADFCEQLLLFDTVCLKIYGENIPISLLINNLGLKQFEELIETNAIEFLLWTPMVLTMEDDLEGVDPLAFGNTSSQAHSDPEESITLGLNWMKNKLIRKERRMLVRKLRDKYSIPDKHFSSKAAALVTDAYKSNKLAGLGAPNDKDVRNLPKSYRTKLLNLVSVVLESTVLSEQNLAAYNMKSHFDISTLGVKSIRNALKLQNDFHKILKLEGILDIKALYLNKVFDLQKVYTIRKSKSSRNFRNWLQKESNANNASDISEKYLEAITGNNKFINSNKGKFLKTVTLSTIGAGIGALVQGIPGGIAGASIGKIVEPFADLGLGLFDSYFLNNMLLGWNPRLYIEDLKKNIEQKN